jgi:ATPase subunit of ABC transporter with duplicated ATPase domains
MENCLQGEIVQGRTVLLVSHHTTLVSPAAAYIVALENVSSPRCQNGIRAENSQGDVKFSGTRADFVDCGLMDELDAEDVKPQKEAEKLEKTVEEAAMKATHKSVVSLSGVAAASGSEPDSETSSLAPEDEVTLSSSTAELKSKPPRKLIEDEKRATGRIAKEVWATYFSVSSAWSFPRHG